jgi:2-dehydro-3-deoxygluconokinase
MTVAVDALQERYDLVTFGEAMIRLTTPAGRRLDDTDTLQVTIGGAEANVCVALARLGRRVAWLSALPDNALGRRIDRELRGHGVDTSQVVWSAGRAGVYFMEQGAQPRPTRVLYDRAESAVARITPSAVDPRVVAAARALHLTGITPALSASCSAVCQRLAESAVAAGIPVVVDVNYRARLWSPDAARSGLRPLLDRASVLFCGAGDAATIWGLGGAADAIAAGLLDRSAARLVVVTLGADGSVAVTRDRRAARVPAIPVEMVDAVGAGDAFAAGFLHRWLDHPDDIAGALRSATALAALKMTLFGDLATITPDELAETLALLDGAAREIDR